MIIPEDNLITFLLIAIISAVSLYALRNKNVFHQLVFHPVSVIHKKEYYRIVSSALVHNNLLHLGLNIFLLYVFCTGIEESIPRSERFHLFLIIINSLLGGNLLSFIVYRRNVEYSSAGASGIVIGCISSYMIFHPFDKHLSIPLLDEIPNIYSMPAFLIIMLAYSKKFNRGEIDYSVHFGGGFGGIVTTVLMWPDLIRNILIRG